MDKKSNFVRYTNFFRAVSLPQLIELYGIDLETISPRFIYIDESALFMIRHELIFMQSITAVHCNTIWRLISSLPQYKTEDLLTALESLNIITQPIDQLDEQAYITYIKSLITHLTEL